MAGPSEPTDAIAGAGHAGNSPGNAIEKNATEKGGIPKSDQPTQAVVSAQPVSNWNKPLGFYLAFISILLMVLLVSIDATALAVAIPAITNELNGTTLEAFWTGISFTLAVVVVQPIYTSLSDVLGRKIPLYAAFLLFTVGSVVFAVAPSMTVLLVGRVLQGLGGGGLDVLNEIIIADLTTLKERPLWVGLVGIPMALGCIMGPIVGALFSERASWRWIGWINLPFLGVALLLAVFFLKLKPIEQSLLSRLAQVDWIGMILFVIGCVAFSLPLSWAGTMYAWSSWQTILPIVLGLATLVAFGIYEVKPANPVFPYRIFRSQTAQATLLGGFIHGMILYVLLLYIPLFFQAVYLVDPLRAAVLDIPICVMVVFFSTFSAVTVEYIRQYRWEIWMGWLVQTIGIGLFALWGDQLSVGMVAGFQIMAGIGLGTLFTVPSLSMQASAPSAADQGISIGILVSFRLFGALMGLSIGAATFSNLFATSIARLGPLPEAVAALTNASEAVGFIPHLRELDLPSEVMDSIRTSYLKAFQPIWYICAGFSGIGFLTSLWVEDLSLETEEVGRQHIEHTV